MRAPKRHLFLGLIALVLFAGACSDTGDGAARETDPVGASEEPNPYSSEVDGVSVRWPEGWQVSGDELNAGRVTNTVELFSLATYADERGDCPADPAGLPMAADDVLLTLRMSVDPAEPGEPRPPVLLAAAEPVPPTERAPQDAWVAGCHRAEAEIRQAQFQEHGRHYEVFLATPPSLSQERRAEVQQIWSNVQLTSPPTGYEQAEPRRAYWHTLYTHCGINSTSFDGREWVADPELEDSHGNPPRGWANPTAVGTIELKDQDTAVFTSRDGEQTATFRPRTSQDPPDQPCA